MAEQHSQSKLHTGLGWFTIVAGALLTLFGIQFLNQANETSDWPAVTGSVLGTRVSYSLSSSANSASRRSYYYIVTYEYKVDEQSYINDQYSAGDNEHGPDRFSEEAEAEAAAASKYPEGSSVTVYYNPDVPEEAYLVAGATGASYIPLILGLVFMLAGYYLVRTSRLENAIG